jgi:hypothetical protein
VPLRSDTKRSESVDAAVAVVVDGGAVGEAELSGWIDDHGERWEQEREHEDVEGVAAAAEGGEHDGAGGARRGHDQEERVRGEEEEHGTASHGG